MTLPRLSLLLALVGMALTLIGAFVGAASIAAVEGASFTRDAGRPLITGVYRVSGSGLSLLSPSDGNLWIGAGISLLLAAAGALFAHGAGLRLVRARD